MHLPLCIFTNAFLLYIDIVLFIFCQLFSFSLRHREKTHICIYTFMFSIYKNRNHPILRKISRELTVSANKKIVQNVMNSPRTGATGEHEGHAVPLLQIYHQRAADALVLFLPGECRNPAPAFQINNFSLNRIRQHGAALRM
jgi:hypothetical protein